MSMTKQDIVQMIAKSGYDFNGLDYARPMQWDAKARELGIDPFWFVFGNGGSEPMNLAEGMLQIIEQQKLELYQQRIEIKKLKGINDYLNED